MKIEIFRDRCALEMGGLPEKMSQEMLPFSQNLSSLLDHSFHTDFLEDIEVKSESWISLQCEVVLVKR